jgi:aryl-alcohol dehydrogenase-like predicted oxidoreductase
MRYRWLGNTGLNISEIGFGAWAIGGSWWGPQDDQDSRLALHQALDKGINFIDTAWVYGDGHSEKLIGSVLKERHERPVIATKVPPMTWNWEGPPGTPLASAFPPHWVRAKTEESLKHLGVQTLDVLQLHTWLAEWNPQAGPLMETVARLKQEGKIRAFGLSLKDKEPDAANDLIRWRQIDTLQVFFNLLYQEPIEKLFPLARQYGVGVIARVPLAFGALSGRFNASTRFIGDDHRARLYTGEGLKATLKKVDKLKFLASRSMPLAEAALKWTLAYPEVSTAIPGIRNPHQARINSLAGDGAVIPPAAARKAQGLYRKNFGLPVLKVPSLEPVPAVFISGAKAVKSQVKTTAKKKPVKAAPKQKANKPAKKVSKAPPKKKSKKK